MDPRGRSCPLAYRYQPEALAGPAQLEAETLYVVGGLYGNLAALRAVLERADREPGGPATVAFNGDFHWLDVDPQEFEAISEMVIDHHATMGNVEAELASQGSGEDAGCGCAYPDYISDEVVDRSNQIMTRLRATAGRFPELVGRLGELPRYLTVSVASSTAIPSRWPAGGWLWRRWSPVIRWYAVRSAGVVRLAPLPTCWTGSAAPTSMPSPAPTPASRTPR